MPRKRTLAHVDTPPVLPLRVNDQLFLNAYFSNGNSAVRAYQTVHPNAKYSTAEVNGYRQLRKASVQAEVQRRVRFECGVTKAWGESTLLRVCAEAEATQDWALLAATAMDAMKLAGFLVEKREIKTVTDEQRTALRDLVQSCMTSRTPTTRMAASVEESPPLTSAPATLPPSTGTEMSDGVSQCAEDTTSGVAADGSDTPHPTAG